MPNVVTSVMNRVLVLLAADGSRKQMPLPADLALRDEYQFGGKRWTVVDVYYPEAQTAPVGAGA